MPITVGSLGEIKKRSNWIFLLYFSWMMCCLVTEFVYANTIILFNLGEERLLEYSPPCSHVGEYSATIHLWFQRIIVNYWKMWFDKCFFKSFLRFLIFFWSFINILTGTLDGSLSLFALFLIWLVVTLSTQGPHSQILMTGGGGGRQRFIFYTQKITTSEFVYPRNSQLF